MYSGSTRECTVGVPGYVLWEYPGMYFGSTRVCTPGVPGYVFWGYPSMYSGGTRYEVRGYPGMYSGGTRICTLGVPRSVFFTLNRIYPSAAITPSVRADSSVLESYKLRRHTTTTQGCYIEMQQRESGQRDAMSSHWMRKAQHTHANNSDTLIERKKNDGNICSNQSTLTVPGHVL